MVTHSHKAGSLRCGELCAAETRSLLASLCFSQPGAPAALCSARCQVRRAADGNKAAKNRGRSLAEMEERAKAEPIGINILGGDKFDAGLAGGEDFFFFLTVSGFFSVVQDWFLCPR